MIRRQPCFRYGGTADQATPGAMRERTETLPRKGTHMNLGDIIRVLDVPATVPAETAPLTSPSPPLRRRPSVPATPNARPRNRAQHGAPAQTARSATCAR